MLSNTSITWLLLNAPSPRVIDQQPFEVFSPSNFLPLKYLSNRSFISIKNKRYETRSSSGLDLGRCQQLHHVGLLPQQPNQMGPDSQKCRLQHMGIGRLDPKLTLDSTLLGNSQQLLANLYPIHLLQRWRSKHSDYLRTKVLPLQRDFVQNGPLLSDCRRSYLLPSKLLRLRRNAQHLRLDQSLLYSAQLLLSQWWASKPKVRKRFNFYWPLPNPNLLRGNYREWSIQHLFYLILLDK